MSEKKYQKFQNQDNQFSLYLRREVNLTEVFSSAVALNTVKDKS